MIREGGEERENQKGTIKHGRVPLHEWICDFPGNGSAMLGIGL